MLRRGGLALIVPTNCRTGGRATEVLASFAKPLRMLAPRAQGDRLLNERGTALALELDQPLR